MRHQYLSLLSAALWAISTFFYFVREGGGGIERHKVESGSFQKFVDLQLKWDPLLPGTHKCWKIRQASKIYSQHN